MANHRRPRRQTSCSSVPTLLMRSCHRLPAIANYWQSFIGSGCFGSLQGGSFPPCRQNALTFPQTLRSFIKSHGQSHLLGGCSCSSCGGGAGVRAGIDGGDAGEGGGGGTGASGGTGGGGAAAKYDGGAGGIGAPQADTATARTSAMIRPIASPSAILGVWTQSTFGARPIFSCASTALRRP